MDEWGIYKIREEDSGEKSKVSQRGALFLNFLLAIVRIIIIIKYLLKW